MFHVLQNGEPLKAHVAGESAATGEAVLSDRTPVVVNDDGDESLDPDKGGFTITTGKQGPQPARLASGFIFGLSGPLPLGGEGWGGGL